MIRAAFISLLLVTLASCTDLKVPAQTWGEEGNRPGQFAEPFDIAVDQNGSVFIVDVRNHRVQKLSVDGKFIFSFGENIFGKPAGIGISPTGDVWVADFDLDRIFHFDNRGILLGSWGKAGNGQADLDSPVDVALDSKGFVYVVDEYHHRVVKYSPDGNYVAAWGKAGKVNVILSALDFILPIPFTYRHEGEFYYPSRIAIDSDDRIYVSDAYNNRIEVFDSDGRFVRSVGGMGIWGGRFRVSAGLAVGQDGSMFVGDFYNNRIQKFDRNGKFIEAWGEAGSEPGRFLGPTGVAVSTDGTLYVADWGNNRVQKFRLDR